MLAAAGAGPVRWRSPVGLIPVPWINFWRAGAAANREARQMTACRRGACVRGGHCRRHQAALQAHLRQVERSYRRRRGAAHRHVVALLVGCVVSSDHPSGRPPCHQRFRTHFSERQSNNSALDPGTRTRVRFRGVGPAAGELETCVLWLIESDGVRSGITPDTAPDHSGVAGHFRMAPTIFQATSPS